MKIKAIGYYSYASGKRERKDLREMAGTLNMKASDDINAELLSRLYKEIVFNRRQDQLLEYLRVKQGYYNPFGK